ncbi:MAG: SufD family Fe-S cluster assembly protein [Bacilli bacterium]|nr:SufD family Fe-S cluster assembly protein [Bacilli bacterium]
MEYILNKSPIRTTNNFKVNDFKIDLDITETDFNSFEYKNINIKTEIRNNLDSKIGLPASKYLYVECIGNDLGYLTYDFDNNYLASEIHIDSDMIIIFKGDNALLNTKVVIDSNKDNNVTIINLTSKESKSFISIKNNIKRGIKSTVNFIELGGIVKVSNYYSINNGENYFNSLYLGKDSDKIDMNYYIGLNEKNSISKMNVQGSLSDKSYKSFKGTIDFYEGSSKSIGEEIENCILLSDESISRSLPMLLCHEEDVEGAHGVSTGKIDEDKLFYLMSRGINEKDAKKLIINANYNLVIDNIPNEDIKKLIKEEINKKL